MLCNFSTKTYGKWILAGEHAVLRGAPALVFPLTSKGLELQFQATPKPFQLHYEGEAVKTAPHKIGQVLQSAFEQIGMTPSGQLYLNNSIPVGTGLGASAALSVAIAEWFKACYKPEIDVFTFARQLEHLLHGQSSGLDIAGSMAKFGCVYFKDCERTEISPIWTPHFKLSYSGQPGNTAECIAKVLKIEQENPGKSASLDNQMAQAVERAKGALTESNSQAELVNAIEAASNCFQAWGLINAPLQKHMDELKKAGALAVKPTGSGFGGHVLSLWNKPLCQESISKK